MSMSRAFFVFMCPKCRRFTNAPVTQKRRRCSYCGKIIEIQKAAKAVFDGAEAAAAAVREFNARGTEEFQAAVERSRDRVRTFLPPERVQIEDITTKGRPPVGPGKQKRLLQLLENHAKEQPCTLDRVAEMCREYRLDWLWVEEQLNKLSNSGVVIFPRPWSVQLVSIGDDDESIGAPVDVSGDIVLLLHKEGGRMSLDDLLKYFQARGIAAVSVEKSLDRLLNNGEIFLPRPNLIALV